MQCDVLWKEVYQSLIELSCLQLCLQAKKEHTLSCILYSQNSNDLTANQRARVKCLENATQLLELVKLVST